MRAPQNMLRAERGPMIMPCPMYPVDGTKSQPQAVAALQPTHEKTGNAFSHGTCTHSFR